MNKVTILNVMYDLLTNYRKSLEAHSETTDDLRNTENDAARSQHLLSLAKVTECLGKTDCIIYYNLFTCTECLRSTNSFTTNETKRDFLMIYC